MTIKNVIDNGYCNGCGACKIYSPDSVEIKFSEDGFYKAKLINNYDDKLNQICPFSDAAINETEIANEIYSSNEYKFDTKVGKYLKIFAGNVLDTEQRLSSSSGGLTTWLAEKLLTTGEIDSIVHVGFIDGQFQYKVSSSIEELRDVKNKKSRYYPVSLNSCCDFLSKYQGNILFVGIPCFVKSIRLLQKNGKLKNVKYCIALLCGHMKSSGFAESLAWQVGISPKNLNSFDFRIKKEGFEASNYFFKAVDRVGNESLSLNSHLLGSNWGLGFFRHQTCDFCDDIAGETADVTLGDAWLPKYTKDYLGTNIVVVRNSKILAILEEFKSELFIENVDVDTFFATQAGNYRNRRGGIVARAKNINHWYPEKRLDLCFEYAGDESKEKIYRYRSKLSKMSINNFNIAKKFNSINMFKLLMLPSLIKYNLLQNDYKSAVYLLIPKKIKTILKK